MTMLRFNFWACNMRAHTFWRTCFYKCISFTRVRALAFCFTTMVGDHNATLVQLFEELSILVDQATRNIYSSNKNLLEHTENLTIPLMLLIFSYTDVRVSDYLIGLRKINIKWLTFWLGTNINCVWEFLKKHTISVSIYVLKYILP